MELNTHCIGHKFIYYKQIDSTQLEIHRRIADGNIKNGTLIIADRQTNGKGTHGRIWHTDEENNIAFSFYVETNCKSDKLEGVTMEIAQTILEAFKKIYNIELNIKYPNDIIFNGKKIGGILTETKVIGKITKYIVVGIGINTNQQIFAEEIKNIASSIKNEFNIDVDNKRIIIEFLNLFEIKLAQRVDVLR